MRDLLSIDLKQYMREGHKKGGFFIIPHFKKNKFFQCIASKDPDGWEHLSFIILNKLKKYVRRVPNYEEVCFINRVFFKEDEYTI